MQVLGRPKEEAAKRFTSAAQEALKRANFLERPTLMTTQAMALLLVSLHHSNAYPLFGLMADTSKQIAFQGRYHRHAAWVLCGVLIRIAVKMGLHRDGEGLGLPPLRGGNDDGSGGRSCCWTWATVWLSGYLDTAFPWDRQTELPRNVTDADISPDSTAPIKPSRGRYGEWRCP